MIKMGGIICDICRVIITGTHPANCNVNLIKSTRKTKKGQTLHFCSEKCKLADTPPKKGAEYSNLRRPR